MPFVSISPQLLFILNLHPDFCRTTVKFTDRNESGHIIFFVAKFRLWGVDLLVFNRANIYFDGVSILGTFFYYLENRICRHFWDFSRHQHQRRYNWVFEDIFDVILFAIVHWGVINYIDNISPAEVKPFSPTAIKSPPPSAPSPTSRPKA
jgi:hypothetical protein